MQLAALIAWVLTAIGGSGLGYLWARGGGVAQAGGIRPSRLLLHAGLAVSGLAIWILFVMEGSSVFAWIAVADLVAVALIGMTMAVTWLRGKAAPTAPMELPAEASFPVPVVLGHGALGATTLLLSLLAAVGVGVQ
jgi:hypothetical protein